MPPILVWYMEAAGVITPRIVDRSPTQHLVKIVRFGGAYYDVREVQARTAFHLSGLPESNRMGYSSRGLVAARKFKVKLQGSQGVSSIAPSISLGLRNK